MKIIEQTTLQALLIALARVETPLSAGLKHEIQELAHDLANNSSDAISKISTLVKKDSQLNDLYQTARLNLQKQYQAQERDKFGISVASTLSLDDAGFLENIAYQILYSNDFQVAIQEIVKRFHNSKDSFLNTLQMASSVAQAKADLKAISILEALEFRPLTVENLAYGLEMDQEQTYQIVKRLWQERKIDTIQGSTLRKILPFLRPKNQSCKIEPTTTYLTLTSLGYFYLHPVIKVA